MSKHLPKISFALRHDLSYQPLARSALPQDGKEGLEEEEEEKKKKKKKSRDMIRFGICNIKWK